MGNMILLYVAIQGHKSLIAWMSWKRTAGVESPYLRTKFTHMSLMSAAVIKLPFKIDSKNSNCIVTIVENNHHLKIWGKS